jgi:hypothetical protein
MIRRHRLPQNPHLCVDILWLASSGMAEECRGRVVGEGSTRPYSMFKDYWKYHWVLEVHRHDWLEGLPASLEEKIIAPAEAKVRELQEKRKLIEEPLCM